MKNNRAKALLLILLFLPGLLMAQEADTSRMEFETRHQGTNARRTYTIDSISVLREGTTLVITGYHPSGRTDPEHQTMVLRIPNFVGRGSYSIANARARWQNLNSGSGYCSSLSGTMEVNAYEEGVIVEATFRFLCESQPRVGDPYNTIVDGEVVKGLEGKFLAQVEGDTLLPQNEYTIEWELSGRGNFDLYYTLEKDPEPEEVEIYEIALDVNPEDGAIEWTTPDTMSPYLWFVVVDRDGLSRHFYSDSMRIRYPRLARVRTDPDGPCPTCPYYEEFQPARHGWREVNGADSLFAPSVGRNPHYSGDDEVSGNPFPSYFLEPPVEAEKEDYPDWPSWVDAFSVDESYVDVGSQGLLPLPHRVENWAHFKQPYDGGCFGMAVTAAYAFYFPERFSARFPEAIGSQERAENLYVVKGNNVPVNTLISRFHAYQFGRMFIYQDMYLGEQSPMEAVEWLRALFLDDMINDHSQKSPMVTIFEGGPDGGAHAMLAYEVEEIEDDPEIRVYVYDPNYPGNEGAYVAVDREQNSWSYEPLGWSGSDGFTALDLVSDYHRDATYYDEIEEGVVRPILYAGLGTGIEAQRENGSSFSWSDEEGYRGDDQDGAPMYAINGPGDPYGYLLGKAGYAIEATASDRSDLRLSLQQPHLTLTYQSDAPAGESDRVRWEEKSMTIHNPGSTSRAMSFDITMSGERLSRTISVTDFVLTGGDSVRFTVEEDDLVIRNFGGPGSYGVTLRQVNEERGLQEGGYDPVDLGAGEEHRIDPPWWNLETRLPIYVEGESGTRKDTIVRINALLSVESERTTMAGLKVSNPLPDLGSISFNAMRSGLFQVEAFNALGRSVGIVVSQPIERGEQAIPIDARGLYPGHYLLAISLNGKSLGSVAVVRMR